MDFLQLILKPWFQRAIACGLGAISALAFAPLFILPAMLLALSGIWFLFEQTINNPNASLRGERSNPEIATSPSAPRNDEVWNVTTVFWLGWWFGLGHFSAGLYWIANALTVDLAAFWWLIPFSLFGIPAVLAIFTGVCFICAAFWPYNGISRVFAFAGIWLVGEWLRGYLFTGFPWNLLGYVWAFSPEMTQLASLLGVYGLSLFILLLGLTLGYLVGKRPFDRVICISVYVLTGACWVWGYDRLNYTDVISSPPLAIRLVQPSIPQTLKWDPKRLEDNFNQLLEMSTQPSLFPLKAIIWPESAVPFPLEYQPYRREVIAGSLPKGALLITGSDRRTNTGVTPRQIWNSLIVLNDQGTIVAHYDKSHLVPFGEYLPFRSTLDALFGKGMIKKITVGAIDFSSGSGPETIPLPEGFPPFSGLVCYEVIFPGAVINSKQQRPGWMINLTNDAWYGNTSGPYQHFEMARFRAIEEGVPLVRVANNGVSVVFDAYGRNMGSIGLNKKEVLDVFLPTPTYKVPLYARLGDWITLILILGTFAFAWLFSFKRD